MIVDFHTHIFPDALAPRALAALRADIRAQQGGAMPVWTDGTAAGLRRSMRESGVDLSVALPVATTLTQSAGINRFAKSVTGGGILSFAGIHPLQPDWESVLGSLAEQGFRGIKLHPEFQNFYIDSPESLRLLKKAEALGLLVAVHAGVDACMAPPVHCPPQRLRRVLEEVSGENIIAAHLGGFAMWDEVERCLVGTPIRMDTGVIGAYIRPEQYRRIVLAHGTDKILFASDSPWESQSGALAALRALKLPRPDEERILGGNAAELLNL